MMFEVFCWGSNKKAQTSSKNDFWISLSDLMTGLMLVFIVLSLTFMAIANKKVNEAEKNEQAMKSLLQKSEEDKRKIEKLLLALKEAKKRLEKSKKNIIIILAEEFKKNNINVEYNAIKGTVTVAQDILFERQKSTLNHDGKEFAYLFAKVLNDNIFNDKNRTDLIKHIHIEGYASKEGTVEHNFNLSFNRAKNVWLTMTSTNLSKIDITKKKLNIVSRGEVDANQEFIDQNDRKVIFRFEFYDDYNKLFEGLSK